MTRSLVRLSVIDLNENGMRKSRKSLRNNHRGTAAASESGNDGQKKDQKMFRQQNSNSH